MALRILTQSSSNKQLASAFLKYMSTSTGQKNVGFVGLGNMGGHMASNLMKHVSTSPLSQLKLLCYLVYYVTI